MRTIIRDNYTPKNGNYHEVILIDEAQNKKWVFDCDGVFTPLDSGEQINVVNSFGDSTTDAISQKFFTDTTYELQDEIKEIKNNPDVVDIVDTYADLQNYDTSSLGDKDIVRVLTDENHDNESTYYRWDKPNNQWVFIGAVEGYYTKAQTDTLLAGKQDTLTAGANITINNNEISATDTTYTAGNGLSLTGTQFSADTSVLATQNDLSSKQDKLTAGSNITIDADNRISSLNTTYNNFTGTDGVDPGEAGLVPAPATTDAGKFLKADGTWDTAGSAINVVQTTGTSTTDVMSQDAATKMVYYNANKYNVAIGNVQPYSPANYWTAIGQANIGGQFGISIGTGTARGYGINIGYGKSSIYGAEGGNSIAIGTSQNRAIANNSISIGVDSTAGENSNAQGAVSIGSDSNASKKGSIALGAYSKSTTVGEMNIGTTSTAFGYNSSNYRLLTGLYDPQAAHDAATKGYVDTAVASAGANTISSQDWSDLWQ